MKNFDPAKLQPYRVEWSDDDKQWVGTCPSFPSLSWLDNSQISALEGIVGLVREALADSEEAPITPR